MLSKTDFNVSPYYDDFSEVKNFIELCIIHICCSSERTNNSTIYHTKSNRKNGWLYV